jgi:hypothetical protein
VTALCGGGASQARPGFGALVNVGTFQIGALLNNVPTPLAVAAAGYIGLVNYDLTTFCANDPPPMPTPTAADWAALLNPSAGAGHLAAVQEFLDLIGNLVWPVFCECASGTTPGPPALPTPPTDLPTVNPTGLPTGTAQQPCWDHSDNFTTTPSATYQDVTSLFVPYNATVTVTAPGGAETTTTAALIPTGVTQYTTDIHVTTPAPPDPGLALEVLLFNAAGTLVHRETLWSGNSGSGTATWQVTSTAVSWQVLANSNIGAGTDAFTMEFIFFCAGQSPANVTTPCCPPDPSLDAQLATILFLLNEIVASLPTPLSSYADGTAHTALSGNGTITLVGDALAIRVNITTDPGYLGLSAGDPPFLFDRGYIVPIVNSAPIRGTTRLVYNPQMYLLPALTEEIGYSLTAGVVATITELVRGP